MICSWGFCHRTWPSKICRASTVLRMLLCCPAEAGGDGSWGCSNVVLLSKRTCSWMFRLENIGSNAKIIHCIHDNCRKNGKAKCTLKSGKNCRWRTIDRANAEWNGSYLTNPYLYPHSCESRNEYPWILFVDILPDIFLAFPNFATCSNHFHHSHHFSSSNLRKSTLDNFTP